MMDSTTQPHVALRPCRADETPLIQTIVNAGAEAYRGVIPDDCFHDPYMPAEALAREIAAGVAFWGAEADGELVGVMGVQPVRDVDLIRHAYVRPGRQGSGIGTKLLQHLIASSSRPILVGTWAAAHWAIGFYERHGFARVPDAEIAPLLRRYWTISDRQIETSVVLSRW